MFTGSQGGTGLFGGPKPGQPAQGGLFGGSGANPPSNPAPSGGLFGSQPPPSNPGSSGTGGSLFGTASTSGTG